MPNGQSRPVPDIPILPENIATPTADDLAGGLGLLHAEQYELVITGTFGELKEKDVDVLGEDIQAYRNALTENVFKAVRCPDFLS
jgi:hypothetical protein